MSESIGPVERAIRSSLRAGQELHLASSGKPFRLGRFDRSGVEVLLGARETPVRLAWDALEGIPGFIRENADRTGWLVVGGAHTSSAEPGRLDAYLKQFTPTNTARWIASLLAAAGVVDVLTRPVRVRLR